MAQRTQPPANVRIEVPRTVRDELHEYQAALQRELQHRATIGEILSALLKGVPLWQARAMLLAHRPRVDPPSDPPVDPPPDDDAGEASSSDE